MNHWSVAAFAARMAASAILVSEAHRAIRASQPSRCSERFVTRLSCKDLTQGAKEAAAAALDAASNSSGHATPSIYLSATSTAVRVGSLVTDSGSNSRQQAKAKSLSFRSLAFPFRNSSIAAGSVQANHSFSVMAVPSLPARQQIQTPTTPDVRA